MPYRPRIHQCKPVNSNPLFSISFSPARSTPSLTCCEISASNSESFNTLLLKSPCPSVSASRIKRPSVSKAHVARYRSLRLLDSASVLLANFSRLILTSVSRSTTSLSVSASFSPSPSKSLSRRSRCSGSSFFFSSRFFALRTNTAYYFSNDSLSVVSFSSSPWTVTSSSTFWISLSIFSSVSSSSLRPGFGSCFSIPC